LRYPHRRVEEAEREPFADTVAGLGIGDWNPAMCLSRVSNP
jgi:hypothetical protein